MLQVEFIRIEWTNCHTYFSVNSFVRFAMNANSCPVWMGLYVACFAATDVTKLCCGRLSAENDVLVIPLREIDPPPFPTQPTTPSIHTAQLYFPAITTETCLPKYQEMR